MISLRKVSFLVLATFAVVAFAISTFAISFQPQTNQLVKLTSHEAANVWGGDETETWQCMDPDEDEGFACCKEDTSCDVGNALCAQSKAVGLCADAKEYSCPLECLVHDTDLFCKASIKPEDKVKCYDRTVCYCEQAGNGGAWTCSDEAGGDPSNIGKCFMSPDP